MLLQQLGLIKVKGKPVLTSPDDTLPTIKDITEQRHAEESLRLMAHAFANTHDAMVVVDHHWRIIEGNTYVRELAGRPQPLDHRGRPAGQRVQERAAGVGVPCCDSSTSSLRTSTPSNSRSRARASARR